MDFTQSSNVLTYFNLLINKYSFRYEAFGDRAQPQKDCTVFLAFAYHDSFFFR